MFSSRKNAAPSAGGYNLTKSLRFRSSASAYLNRTPASSGNLRLWTLSWWTKRGQLSTAAQTTMFGTDYASSQECQMQFTAGNKFVLEQYASAGATNLGNLISTQVFRDPAAWYHIVVTWDSAQATASNRIKVYINGVQITAWDTASYPAQNADSVWNQSTNAHYIGRYSTAKYYDGYQTEINFIDGQALTPSSFGATSSTTGVWQPIKYTGTYGTNGFYLPFTDTSSTTNLVKDSSGNGNNWTPNNISLTAGVTYDSMTDVPTNTSATVANYCTLNPLTAWRSVKPSDGNLVFSSGTADFATGTMLLPAGKWYCEVKILGGNNEHNVGFINLNSALISSFPSTATIRGSNAFTLYTFDGKFYDNGTASAALTTFAANDIIMLAYDADNSKIYVGKNGTWLNSAVPASGTGAVSTTATAPLVVATQADAGNATGQEWNFGAGSGFAYTLPSGFVALNTFNLPTPTIGATATTQANKYMDATLYTGTGANQSITNSGSMQPDFVWIKVRNVVTGHLLFDAIRGVNNVLRSNETTAEGGVGTYGNTLTAFNSNGFSLGNDAVIPGGVNGNTNTYVGWQWNAGGSNATNTSGSITSTVRASTTAGFSIVTYTGTGALGTVGHGLGVAPSMVIVKRRSAASSWVVGTTAAGWTGQLYLDTTGAFSSNSGSFNNTAPTSSVFTVNTDSTINANTSTYVAYCFAAVAGYSAFGSYTGNGSADGPFVYTGFRPRWFFIKRSDSGLESWYLWDTARDTYNVMQTTLLPNSSNAESTGASRYVDGISNGLKIRSTDTLCNASGGTYIYAAFAESPFKYSNAR